MVTDATRRAKLIEGVVAGAAKAVAASPDSRRLSWAFTDVTNVEFNQPHIHEWVNKYWPYTKKSAELGYTNGKPTGWVSSTCRPYRQIVQAKTGIHPRPGRDGRIL